MSKMLREDDAVIGEMAGCGDIAQHQDLFGLVAVRSKFHNGFLCDWSKSGLGPDGGPLDPPDDIGLDKTPVAADFEGGYFLVL